MEIKGFTQMNQTLKTIALTTAAIGVAFFCNKAHASDVRDYGAQVGTCNEHGWLFVKGDSSISIGKSHDVILNDEGQTHHRGWTHVGDGTIRIHSHVGRDLMITPMCHGGGFRF